MDELKAAIHSILNFFHLIFNKKNTIPKNIQAHAFNDSVAVVPIVTCIIQAILRNIICTTLIKGKKNYI